MFGYYSKKKIYRAKAKLDDENCWKLFLFSIGHFCHSFAVKPFETFDEYVQWLLNLVNDENTGNIYETNPNEKKRFILEFSTFI